MNEHRTLTPAEAESLLAASATGRSRGDEVSRRAWLGPALSVAIGILVGAFLLAGVYVLPGGGLAALLVSLGYVVCIVAATTTYNLARRANQAGWLRRYQLGLAVTMGVFAMGLALSFLLDERSLWLWLPIAVAAALPICVIAGPRRSK